jgi:hypothetical protein
MIGVRDLSQRGPKNAKSDHSILSNVRDRKQRDQTILGPDENLAKSRSEFPVGICYIYRLLHVVERINMSRSGLLASTTLVIRHLPGSDPASFQIIRLRDGKMSQPCPSSKRRALVK